MNQTPLPQLASLLEAYSWRRFKKGQTILFQGEVPRDALVIKEGVVKTYNISPQGDEQIISLSSPFDILPEAWFLHDASVAYYFYEAYTDCKIYLIPRDVLIQKVSTSPELGQFLLQRAMRLHVGAKVHVNALEHSKSRDKLIHLLHYLMLRFGEDIDDKGKVRIDLRLTHQTLANMLGTTRETIALEMMRLRKENVVSYRRQMYIIDKPKLLQLRHDDDFIAGL